MKPTLFSTAFALLLTVGCGSQSSPGAPPDVDASTGDSNTASPAGNTEVSDAGVAPPPPPSATLGGPIPVGMYSWNEIEAVEPQMKALGESVHRLAGPLSDSEWATVLRLGVKAMFTSDPYRNVPDTLSHLDRVLKRYGPGGTYWVDNPTAPNRPLEAIEITNEPNYIGFSADTYASILVAAYPYIKANWPSVTVVGMSCGNNYASAVPWMSVRPPERRS